MLALKSDAFIVAMVDLASRASTVREEFNARSSQLVAWLTPISSTVFALIYATGGGLEPLQRAWVLALLGVSISACLGFRVFLIWEDRLWTPQLQKVMGWPAGLQLASETIPELRESWTQEEIIRRLPDLFDWDWVRYLGGHPTLDDCRDAYRRAWAWRAQIEEDNARHFAALIGAMGGVEDVGNVVFGDDLPEDPDEAVAALKESRADDVEEARSVARRINRISRAANTLFVLGCLTFVLALAIAIYAAFATAFDPPRGVLSSDAAPVERDYGEDQEMLATCGTMIMNRQFEAGALCAEALGYESADGFGALFQRLTERDQR